MASISERTHLWHLLPAQSLAAGVVSTVVAIVLVYAMLPWISGSYIAIGAAFLSLNALLVAIGRIATRMWPPQARSHYSLQRELRERWRGEIQGAEGCGHVYDATGRMQAFLGDIQSAQSSEALLSLVKEFLLMGGGLEGACTNKLGQTPRLCYPFLKVITRLFQFKSDDPGACQKFLRMWLDHEHNTLETSVDEIKETLEQALQRDYGSADAERIIWFLCALLAVLQEDRRLLDLFDFRWVGALLTIPRADAYSLLQQMLRLVPDRMMHQNDEQPQAVNQGLLKLFYAASGADNVQAFKWLWSQYWQYTRMQNISLFISNLIATQPKSPDIFAMVKCVGDDLSLLEKRTLLANMLDTIANDKETAAAFYATAERWIGQHPELRDSAGQIDVILLIRAIRVGVCEQQWLTLLNPSEAQYIPPNLLVEILRGQVSLDIRIWLLQQYATQDRVQACETDARRLLITALANNPSVHSPSDGQRAQLCGLIQILCQAGARIDGIVFSRVCDFTGNIEWIVHELLSHCQGRLSPEMLVCLAKKPHALRPSSIQEVLKPELLLVELATPQTWPPEIDLPVVACIQAGNVAFLEMLLKVQPSQASCKISGENLGWQCPASKERYLLPGTENTPLHYAAWIAHMWRSPEMQRIIVLLRTYGAQDDAKNSAGQTPLERFDASVHNGASQLDMKVRQAGGNQCAIEQMREALTCTISSLS